MQYKVPYFFICGSANCINELYVCLYSLLQHPLKNRVMAWLDATIVP